MKLGRSLLVVSLASLACALLGGQARAADAAQARPAVTAKAKAGAKPSEGALAKTHAAAGVKCADCHGKGARRAVEMDRCTACHATKDLAAQTANVKPRNPHENRHYGTEGDCNMCHHQHRPSENACAKCHPFDFKVK